MNSRKAILVLGIFVNENAKRQNIRTAEDRLAAMLRRNNIPVITSSAATGRFQRLRDNISIIFRRREDYDIVVVPLFGTGFSFIWHEIVARMVKMLKKKLVVGIHGGSIPGRIDAGATKFFTSLKRADVLVAPSAYFQTYFQQKGFDMRIIYNPIDFTAYMFCSKNYIKPRVIWMRAFTDIYNPLMAVRVAEKLATKYDGFKMVMAGKEGQLLNAAKALAAEKKLTDKIDFPGYINMQQKQQLANNFDIYICTNKVDNAPVSLVEFMRFGLPIVSVNAGGIPYLIKDGENGLLVNLDDDNAMFEKICSLIDDQALAQSVIKKAYDYTAQFDEILILEQWEHVFTILLGIK